MSAEFENARKQLREKLGLSAASNAVLAAVASSSAPAEPTSSVLHRILEFEDKCQEPEPDLTPLPQALVHSLSGSWKPLVLDSGKSAWQRDERTGLSNETVKASIPATPTQQEPHPAAHRQHKHDAAQRWVQHAVEQTDLGGLVLQLPEVHTLEQAQAQVDQLQQQAYQHTRHLHEARVVARQAAEQLLSSQMHASGSCELTGQTTRAGEPDSLAATLNSAQAHTLEASQQASLAELVAGLAEARASFLEHAHVQVGQHVPDTPHDSANSYSGSTGSSPEPTAPQSTPAAATPAAASDMSNTVGTLMPNGGLSALRLTLDRPLQTRSAQTMQNAAQTPESRSLATSPKAGAHRPSSKTCKRSLSLPTLAVAAQQQDTDLSASSPTVSQGDTLSVNGDSATSRGDSNTAESADDESASGLTGSVQASTASSGEQPDAISTMAQKAAACLGAQVSTASSGPAKEDATCQNLPPLPDLPSAEAIKDGAEQKAADGDREQSTGSSKYMQIGCAAVAYLCLAAVWARSSSAVAFASYFFPT